MAGFAGPILGILAGINKPTDTGDQGFPEGGEKGLGGYYDDSSGNDASWYGGYYGGYGGYGGGSSIGKTPEETQEETQAQINDTTANYLGRAGDLNDLGKKNLKNAIDQVKQNNASLAANRRNDMRQVNWQPNQQKEQSTLQALRDRMGNAAYGSSVTDLMEGLARVDDMNDVQLINTWKQNDDKTYNNWFQANEDLVADYIDQVTALQDEFSKLYSQYWSTMSNINPLLVSEENMKKARLGEPVSVGEDTDAYTLPSISGIGPDENLKALMNTDNDDETFLALTGIPRRGSAVNPYTREYVRPDKAVTQANGVGNTGSRNMSTVANRRQMDNLNAYQRRV